MSSRFCVFLLLAANLAGCAATQKVATSAKNFVMGIYKATSQQILVANQRATKAYQTMPPAEKTKLKESGTRYLAVRTEDPTPEQMVKIKAEMKKPGGGRYGSSSSSAPKKVYCVMVWDTVAQQVVGNNCYAVVQLPEPGMIANFDVYSAQYVGAL